MTETRDPAAIVFIFFASFFFYLVWTQSGTYRPAPEATDHYDLKREGQQRLIRKVLPRAITS